MHELKTASGPLDAVDNTDWLKTAAIIFVSAGHFGFFFVDDDLWWSICGRFAAPPFFFLIGFAQSRKVPLSWIWIGLLLTVLESWNAEWTWVAPNILLSFVLIRIARPSVLQALQTHGWVAFAVLVCGLIAAQPVAAKLFDYGAEGWLWALFGLCQRQFAEHEGAAKPSALPTAAPPAIGSNKANWRIMRLAACIAAALVFLWQEQKEYAFPPLQLTLFIAGLAVMTATLCFFARGPSHLQPAQPFASALRFIGRHTFEIYAIQLAGSELLVKLMPKLAP